MASPLQLASECNADLKAKVRNFPLMLFSKPTTGRLRLALCDLVGDTPLTRFLSAFGFFFSLLPSWPLDMYMLSLKCEPRSSVSLAFNLRVKRKKSGMMFENSRIASCTKCPIVQPVNAQRLTSGFEAAARYSGKVFHRMIIADRENYDGLIV
jgi:hypothetical protein